MLKRNGRPSNNRHLRIPVSVAAVVITASLGGAPVSSAQAATQYQKTTAHSAISTEVNREAAARCQPGNFCLFEHADATGRIVELQVGAKRLSYFDFDNEASYVWNRTSHRFCLHERNSYWGARLFYDPGVVDNLADGGGWWNDRASSAVRCDPR